MEHSVLIGLTAIVVLGIASQWLAWRLHIPSILLLLSAGVLVGQSGLGLLDPDSLLGPLLLPLVSLSVAVILFEGGLSLRIRELLEIGGALTRLTTLGALVTWLVAALAARYVLGFEWPLALLLGAVLIVTGPTVIGPMLRHLRLGGRVGALLKWEGIVIDPIGAILAVMVYTLAIAKHAEEARSQVAVDIGLTFLTGSLLGLAAAALLFYPLRHYWIPDALQNSATLAVVFGTFALSNHLRPESGLLAVTIMGIALANQRAVSVRHVIEFKENLTVLLLSSLFVILAARLERDDLRTLDGRSALFLAILILVARPLAVLVSTIRSPLSWRERAFLCWMAPRGIVAAAVTSVFALEMAEAGFQRADRMVPITFMVVFGTVLLYGLSASSLARWLKLARPNPQGILFVGAHSWPQALAKALQAEGCSVMLVDSDWDNVAFARQLGLPTYYGSITAERTMDDISFGELGRLLAMTSNNAINALACLRYVEVFGRREVYQLPFRSPGRRSREAVSVEQRGRLLFGADVTYDRLIEKFGEEPVIKATRLTKEFPFEAFREMHGESALPLFLINDRREITVFTTDKPPSPAPGQVLISAFSAEPVPGNREP